MTVMARNTCFRHARHAHLLVKTGLQLILFVFFALPAFADSFVISKMHQSTFAPFIEPLLTEAYNALGHDVRFHPYPAKRSIRMADSGKTDGDMLRVQKVRDQYPNLVPVPIAISHTRMVAATIRPDIAIHNWHSLQNWSVGILNGQVLSERHARGNPVIPYNSYEHLFQAGNKGKVSLVILPELNAIQILAKKGRANKMRILPNALAKIELFHVLNKKHAPLIEAMSVQFHKMKKSGRIGWFNKKGREGLTN